MEFYLSIDGEKHGPVSLFRVGELLSEGTVTAETLGWHRDMGGWRPLEEIPALATLIERERSDRRPPPLPAPEEAEESDEWPRDEASATSQGPRQAERDLVRRSGERGETPSIASTDAPAVDAGEGAAGEPAVPSLARPMRRLLARGFDYLLVTVVVSLASSYVPPQMAEGESLSQFFERYFESSRSPEAVRYVWTQFFALLAWHGIEAVLIHLVGSTPGKWLFRIQVVTDARRRLLLPRSLARSYLVYLFGVGLYLGPLALIALAFSLFRLVATGGFLWDQTLGLRVEGRALGPRRILFVVVAFLVMMMLPSLKIS